MDFIYLYCFNFLIIIDSVETEQNINKEFIDLFPLLSRCNTHIFIVFIMFLMRNV